MGSSYYGEGKMGNELRGSSGGRKGKKNNSSSSSENNKPKLPQRGLGVAQLEKIRLHSQMASSTSFHPSNFIHEDPRVQIAYSSSVPSSTSFSYSSYSFQPNNIMMGLSEYEKTNIRSSYADSQPTNTTSGWEHGNANMLENQYSSAHQSNNNISLPFLNLYDSQDITESKKHRSNNGSMGSSTSTHHSESSDHTHHQELDLELRLSL